MEVLLVRAGSLGDVLLLRRAVASLRNAGHGVLLLAPAGPGGALVGPGPSEVTGLVPWDRADVAALFAEAGRLPPELPRLGLAVVYSRNETLARRLRSVIPRVLTQDPAPPRGTHASPWLAQPLADQGIPIVAPLPCVPTPQEEAAAQPWLRRLPSGFLAIHPGSGAAAKNWPLDRFLDLASVVATARPWLFVTGPAEEGLQIEDARAVVARNLSPRVLGAVLARAGLYVGNDSGVTHLAASWGAPTLALFGPSDPAVWAPAGPRVRVVCSPTPSMADLATEAVLKSWASGPPRN